MDRRRFVSLYSSLLLLLAMLPSGGGGLQADVADDRAALLAGVKEIAAPGWPGCLCVFGPEAFVVLTGREGAIERPVVAAARFGQGRLVVFGHNGYFSRAAWGIAGTGQLMQNAVRWLGAGQTPRILVEGLPEFAALLREAGFTVTELNGELGAALAEANILVTIGLPAYSRERIGLVQNFVKKGGGLLTGDTGWGWLQLHPGKSLAADHGGNQIIAPAGVMWADGGLSRTGAHGFAADRPPSPFAHAATALAALEESAAGTRTLRQEELAQASQTLIHAIRVLPLEDMLLRPRLAALEARYAEAAVPTPQKPLQSEQALARLALAFQLERLRDVPPEQIQAHPAAAAFPGAVSPQAPRVERQIFVDLRQPGWHSTGLYAPPGELITITPLGELPEGLAVQIGCHTDQLWHLDMWKRCPEIVRRFPLGKTETKAANAFGGLIYIVVPDNAPAQGVALRIAGAVAAPYYILGRTSPAEWRQERLASAPWAELESANIVLTVPAELIRQLDNPAPLMDFWNHVADACQRLLGRPLARRRPERYVADVQISAGYMHSGFPIMTHLDGAAIAVDLARLRSQGSWGHFHELGHNHQSPDWTFEGTGEVTVNLFSLYIAEHCCHLRESAHPAIKPEERERKMREYFAAGPSFAKWKSDPFLALYMYMQLQEAFGWEVFTRVFREYDALPEAARPKTDEEKRDQWLIRFSRAVGHNLGPFFTAWGIPTSEAARQAIAEMPVWMPEGFPPQP